MIQWFENGDHYNDGAAIFEPKSCEGQVVGFVTNTDLNDSCDYCGKLYMFHGEINPKYISRNYTNKDGDLVCPGDFIIQLDDGVYTACPPTVTRALFNFKDEEQKRNKEK